MTPTSLPPHNKFIISFPDERPPNKNLNTQPSLPISILKEALSKKETTSEEFIKLSITCIKTLEEQKDTLLLNMQEVENKRNSLKAELEGTIPVLDTKIKVLEENKNKLIIKQKALSTKVNSLNLSKEALLTKQNMLDQTCKEIKTNVSQLTQSNSQLIIEKDQLVQNQGLLTTQLNNLVTKKDELILKQGSLSEQQEELCQRVTDLWTNNESLKEQCMQLSQDYDSLEPQVRQTAQSLNQTNRTIQEIEIENIIKNWPASADIKLIVGSTALGICATILTGGLAIPGFAVGGLVLTAAKGWRIRTAKKFNAKYQAYKSAHPEKTPQKCFDEVESSLRNQKNKFSF